jgi:hypothetical protein
MKNPVTIGGVENGGVGMICTRSGHLSTVSNVLVSPQSSANILSLSLLVDKGHYVKFKAENDIFEVRFSGDKNIYYFTRSIEWGKKSRHYGCLFNPHKKENTCVTDARDNVKAYTKDEVNRAKAAREQSQMLGFMSTDAHCVLIKSGD